MWVKFVSQSRSDGDYSGDALALQLKTSLNNSTNLGNFKGGWDVKFDPQKFNGNGALTMLYQQNEVPAKGGADLNIYSTITALPDGDGIPSGVPYAGQAVNLTNDATASTIHGNLGTSDLAQNVISNIINTKNGIFPNDGELDVIIKPKHTITLAEISTAFDEPAGNENLQLLNQATGVFDKFEVSNATGAEAGNGWTYEGERADGTKFYFYYKAGTEGEFGIGTSGQ